jgi:hypothetical protein
VPVKETLDGYFTYGVNVSWLVGNEEHGIVVAHHFDD